MSHGQSPFGTPPPIPPVADPPVGQQMSSYWDESDLRPMPSTGSGRSARVLPDRTPPRQRPPGPELPQPRRRRRRTGLMVLACLCAMVSVSACGVGGWLLWRDHMAPVPAPSDSAPSADPVPTVDLLASRDTDPDPLTEAELFTKDALAPEGANAYPVVTTQALDKCGKAGSGKMDDLLEANDCSQVVRATVTDPSGDYLATVGVVNLADAGAAVAVRDALESGDGGGFTALRDKKDATRLGLDPTVLGFNAFGHYLLYAVVGRADGEAPTREEPQVSTIVDNLVDGYLMDRLEPRQRP